MSIHIRVYPQYGSIGYARNNRRRFAMQGMQAQRSLQLQSMRLQNELRTQQQEWAPNTVGQGAYGYNTGIAGGLPGFNGGYGMGMGYGSPVQVAGYGFPGQVGGYGFPGQVGCGSAMQGGYGCQPGSVGQFNGVNQFGGYGTVTNANTYRSYGGAYAPAYGVGYANAGYGAGLLGGLGSIGASIGNMFTGAFRGW